MRKPGAKEKYIAETFEVEDAHLRAIRSELAADGKDGIQVGAPDARILQFLVRVAKVRSIVEVGTLYGYSTLCLARALPDDGKVISIEFNEANYQKAKAHLEKTESWAKMDLRQGDAVKVLQELRGPVDMVFIDANKGAYLDYLNWAEENVRPGGLIVGDNTFLFDSLFGESRDPNIGEKQIAVMREFNRRLADPAKYNSALIPTAEGITVAQKL